MKQFACSNVICNMAQLEPWFPFDGLAPRLTRRAIMTSMHHSIRVGAALGSPYRRRGLPLRARAVYATAASAVPLTLALTLAATTVPGAAQDTTPPQWPDPIAAPVKVGRLYSGNAPVLRPQIALPTPSKQPETQRPLDTTPRPVKGGASDPLTSSAPAGGVATHPKIHVVYAGDKETVPGVKMSIRSLLRSARRPDDVIIHFIGDEPLSELPNVDFISVKELDAKYDLLRFSGGKIEDGHGNLNAPANYARFVLADIFHDAQKILWLDGDTLVKCDVADLVHPALKKSPHVIAAVVRPSNRRTIDYAKYGPTVLSTMSTSWNAGVFVVDLERFVKTPSSLYFSTDTRQYPRTCPPLPPVTTALAPISLVRSTCRSSAWMFCVSTGGGTLTSPRL